jgi:hypothetical protein
MKYLVNVDWLEFTAISTIDLTGLYAGSIYKISDVLSLEITTDWAYYNKNYNYCFRILYKKVDIGKFYAKVLDLYNISGRNSEFRIDNQTLYRHDLGDILKSINDGLMLNNTLIKKLDVCFDTDVDILAKFKNLYYDPNIQFRFKNKIRVNGTGNDDEELRIGSFKCGTKYISIYDKTKEINKASNKEYIRNIHHQVFGYKSIFRLELRIGIKHPDRKNISVSNLHQSQYLETILNTYIPSMISFNDIKSNTNISFVTINNTSSKIKRTSKPTVMYGGKKHKAIINFLDEELDHNAFNGKHKELKLVRDTILKEYGLATWHKTRKKK